MTTETKEYEELKKFLYEHGIVGIACRDEPECDVVEALAEYIVARDAKQKDKWEKEARIHELEMALDIEDLWASPATKRQAYFEKRLKTLRSGKLPGGLQHFHLSSKESSEAA